MAGGLIGLISGGALGFAASKYREKEQQKQQFKQTELKGYMDDAEQSPEVVNNPEWEKAFRKSIGDPEAADAAMMHFKVHAAEKSRQQQQLQQLVTGLFGGGGPPTPQGGTTPPTGSVQPAMAGAPSSPGQGQPAPGPGGQPQPGAPPNAPDYAGKIQRLIAAKASLGMQGFAPDTVKTMGSAIDEELKLAFEQMKASANTPEAKAAVKKAEAEAALKVNYSPEAISGAARKSGAEAAAGASAREGVELSPSVRTAKIKQSVDEAVAKSKALGETPAQQRAAGTAARQEANSRIVRLKNLHDMYSKDNPPPSMDLWGTKMPAWKADRDKYIRDKGIDPDTGAELNSSDGDVVKGTAVAPSSAGKDGEVRRNKQTGEYRAWRGGKWVPSDATGSPIGG